MSEQVTKPSAQNHPKQKGKYDPSDEWRFVGIWVGIVWGISFYAWWATIGNFGEHLNDPLFKYGALPTFVLCAGFSMFLICKVPFEMRWSSSIWIGLALSLVIGAMVFLAYSKGDVSMMESARKGRVILAIVATVIFGPPLILLWAQAMRPDRATDTSTDSSNYPSIDPSGDPQNWTLWDVFATNFSRESHIAAVVPIHVDGTAIDLPIIVNFSFQANCKYYAIFISARRNTAQVCEEITKQIDGIHKYVSEGPNPIWKWVGDSAITKFSELKFTGRIYVYHETPMTVADLGKLQSLFDGKGLSPGFRSLDYLELRKANGGKLGRPTFPPSSTMPVAAATTVPTATVPTMQH